MIRIFYSALSILFLFVGNGVNASEKKPNIVFILADDLGWAELGCYGQKKIRTPRIDSIANSGKKFTRAYSGNAVCAPSRCVLLTGKHPGHAVVRNNKSMKPLGEPEGQYPLPATEKTIASLLTENGYQCGAFGKWGLGNTQSTGNPLKKGFHRFFGYNCQSHAHSYYPATLWSDNELYPLKNDPPISGHSVLPAGLDEDDPRSYDQFKGQDYAPDHINQAALDFIRQNKDKPFFCYYPTIIPHLALHVPDEDLKPYLAMGWNETPFTKRGKGGGYTPHQTPRAGYAAFITRMDKYVGKVLDLLKELNLEENTIVVFTSDNGATYLPDVDYEFFESVGPLRGLKGSLYEGGIRVPLVVKWPGKIKPGSETDYVTGFEDWLPTLLELTGAEAMVPPNIDGISIVPTLLGKSQPEREFLYREFPAYGGQQALWLGNQWKAIRQDIMPRKANQGNTDLAIELYDLVNDIGETKDVAVEHPEIVNRAAEIMKREHTPSAEFKFPLLDKE